MAFSNILVDSLWIDGKTRFERFNVSIQKIMKKNCSEFWLLIKYRFNYYDLARYELSRARLVERLSGTSSSSQSSGGVGIRPLYVPELLGPGLVARARAVRDEASGNG